jgi:hypothetical protein
MGELEHVSAITPDIILSGIDAMDLSYEQLEYLASELLSRLRYKRAKQLARDTWVGICLNNSTLPPYPRKTPGLYS